MTIARKDYSCDLCDGPIKKGTDHEVFNGKPWDHSDMDTYWTFRNHKECGALTEALEMYTEEGIDQDDWLTQIEELFEGVWGCEEHDDIVSLDINHIFMHPFKEGTKIAYIDALLKWKKFYDSLKKEKEVA